MVKDIITIDSEIDGKTGYDILSVRTDEIDSRKENKLMREIIINLKDTMNEHNLVTLAANQIGYSKRVMCIRFGKDDIRSMINPIISNAKGLTLSRENCASIPDKQYIRPRNNELQVVYQNPLNKVVKQKMIGLSAATFQRSLDMLDGLLLCDIGLEVDELYDNATEEEREEVLTEYLKSMDIRVAQAKKDVEDDEEAKQMSDAIDYMVSVNSGETKTVNAEYEVVDERIVDDENA